MRAVPGRSGRKHPKKPVTSKVHTSTQPAGESFRVVKVDGKEDIKDGQWEWFAVAPKRSLF
jgi:hypothetical protein